MKRILATVAVVGLLAFAPGAAYSNSPTPSFKLARPDGSTVTWTDWARGRGPCVVVLWASWLPDHQRTTAYLAEIARAAREKGLELVVIALQEPIENSRRTLGSTSHIWLHDRHGASLRHFMVFQVPEIVVVDSFGAVTARLGPETSALRAWIAIP